MNRAEKFSFNQDAAVLVVKVSGFLGPEEAEAFQRGLIAYSSDARKSGKPLRLLIDATDCGIQSHEMTSQMSAMTGTILRSTEDRLAIVLTSSLLKMQAKRALPAEGVETFPSQDEARIWLAS